MDEIEKLLASVESDLNNLKISEQDQKINSNWWLHLYDKYGIHDNTKCTITIYNDLEITKKECNIYFYFTKLKNSSNIYFDSIDIDKIMKIIKDKKIPFEINDRRNLDKIDLVAINDHSKIYKISEISHKYYGDHFYNIVVICQNKKVYNYLAHKTEIIQIAKNTNQNILSHFYYK